MMPEELTKLIGQGGSVRIFEVEKGAIKKFADAIDDRNPLYWDEEYARNSRYGSIIAPPGFFGWPTKWARGSTFPLTPEGDDSAEPTPNPRPLLQKAGYGRGLDGGIEYEFFGPVRAGDTLAVRTTIKDMVEREGKAGNMIFVIIETTYTNQDGKLVAKARQTSINR